MLTNILKHFIKEMSSKVSCFAGFCHHHLVTTSRHIFVHSYPLFESVTKLIDCEQVHYVETV